MAPFVIFPLDAADFDLLKIQAFRIRNTINTNNTIVGSIKDLNILIIASIISGINFLGCNAHIVLLAHYLHVMKNHPPGVEIRNSLKFNQKNNVCVAQI